MKKIEAIIRKTKFEEVKETLEELAEENRQYFLESGGESYNYISALNDQPAHIEMMAELIQQATV